MKIRLLNKIDSSELLIQPNVRDQKFINCHKGDKIIFDGFECEIVYEPQKWYQAIFRWNWLNILSQRFYPLNYFLNFQTLRCWKFHNIILVLMRSDDFTIQISSALKSHNDLVMFFDEIPNVASDDYIPVS